MIHRLSLIALVAGVTSACSTPSSIETKSASVRAHSEVTTRAMPTEPLPVTAATPGTAASADERAAVRRPVARRASRPWHGARMAEVQSDEMLPPIFYETRSISFDDSASNGRVSIAVVAERLSRMTGVPVRVKADVYSSGAKVPPAAAPSAQAQSPIIPSPTPLPDGQAGAAAAGGGEAAGKAGASSVPGAGPALPLGQATQVSGPSFVQPITDVSSVEMRWKGTVASFLEHVTGRLNLSWSYRNGVVVIERFVTETFELMAFGGTNDYKMALTGGSSGTSGAGGTTGSSTSTLDLSETGKLAALDSLRRAVESMVQGSGGSVVVNEGTGRFFVTAPRDVMARVREVVKAEDTALQRQAHIQFDVYSVVTNDADEKGVDWSIVYQSLSKVWGATIKSPTSLAGSTVGSTGFNLLSAVPGSDASARFGGTQIVLNLLNQVGTNAMHRPVSLIALNRQWARKTNLKVDGYVSETTPSTSSSAGSGAPGLKTSSITTGDKFIVQPAIMDNGTILLKFGVSLTELLGLFDVTAGSGETLQKVQTPVTSGTDDQGTIRLQPGEAMVVTGLSRRLATSDRRALADGAPVVMGGSRKEGFKREDFLIVVRATQL